MALWRKLQHKQKSCQWDDACCQLTSAAFALLWSNTCFLIWQVYECVESFVYPHYVTVKDSGPFHDAVCHSGHREPWCVGPLLLPCGVTWCIVQDNIQGMMDDATYNHFSKYYHLKTHGSQEECVKFNLVFVLQQWHINDTFFSRVNVMSNVIIQLCKTTPLQVCGVLNSKLPPSAMTALVFQC